MLASVQTSTQIGAYELNQSYLPMETRATSISNLGSGPVKLNTWGTMHSSGNPDWTRRSINCFLASHVVRKVGMLRLFRSQKLISAFSPP